MTIVPIKTDGESATGQPWWHDAIVYQIYPATFADSTGSGTGDLKGILSKLDYLKSLGINTIWISPYFQSPQYDLGYDISDYTKVHAPYGKVADIEAIVAGGKERGIKVLADLVINHTSHEHAWFEESRSSKDNPKRDWYIWRPAKYVDGKRCPPNNWRAAFGGSAWTWDEKTEEYYFHIFLAEQPDLNWENPATRDAIYDDAVKFWLDRGIAGFRIDTCNMYSKDLTFPDAPIVDEHTEYQPCWNYVCNGPRLHEFIKELRSKALGSQAVTIGELPNTPDWRDVLTFVSKGAKELDMVLQFDIASLDHRGWSLMETSWKLAEFKHYSREGQRLADKSNDGWPTNYIGNHDQGRCVSRYGNDAPEYRVASAKMIATWLMTLSGTSIVYQGDEIGMINIPKSWDIKTEYKDCDSLGFLRDAEAAAKRENNPGLVDLAVAGIHKSARDHARTPMQWDSSANGGFSTAKSCWMRANDSFKTINVAAQRNDPDSVLNFYRKVIQLRKDHASVFIHGAFHFDDDTEAKSEDVFIFTKECQEEGKTAVVVLNFSKEEQKYELPAGSGSLKVVLDTGDAGARGVLTPFAAKIYM